MGHFGRGFDKYGKENEAYLTRRIFDVFQVIGFRIGSLRFLAFVGSDIKLYFSFYFWIFKVFFIGVLKLFFMEIINIFTFIFCLKFYSL